MYLIKPLFFVSILLVSVKGLSQSTLEKAESYFSKKYEIIKNEKANSKNINQAIKLFNQSDQEPERTIGLLKSYEFKASWTNVSSEEKRSLYKKAIELAEKQVTEFPENGAIAYWHVANYARWADLIDITEAAQQGVIDDIKMLAEKAIELDRKYNQAGALRLLGGIHLEAPSIPLILSWPSNDEAKKLLKKAYKIAPDHPANVFLYAKMLHIIGKDKKAGNIFEELNSRGVREKYILVDQKYISKGKEYYEENF
jgi:tetratricopeptide (TPR) repeat protein